MCDCINCKYVVNLRLRKEKYMSAKYSIKQLVEKENECIMVPCIYDCGSALAAELSGAKMMLLSGGELGESMMGALECMLTADEMAGAVDRICAFSNLPLMVDCGPGFDNPLSAFRTASKFVRSGAMGLLVGDEPGMNTEDYLAILRAALKAAEGSECVVIARKNGRLDTQKEIDETVKLMNVAVEEGAAGTMCCGLSWAENADQLATELGSKIKGWGCYPDQNSVNGVPDVDNDVIYGQGYKMITYHYMMKVAVAAMWEYGLENMKNKNNVASNEHKMPNGLTGASALPLYNMQRYMDLLTEFTGVEHVFKVPGSRKGRENG